MNSPNFARVFSQGRAADTVHHESHAEFLCSGLPRSLCLSFLSVGFIMKKPSVATNFGNVHVRKEAGLYVFE